MLLTVTKDGSQLVCPSRIEGVNYQADEEKLEIYLVSGRTMTIVGEDATDVIDYLCNPDRCHDIWPSEEVEFFQEYKSHGGAMNYLDWGSKFSLLEDKYPFIDDPTPDYSRDRKALQRELMFY